MFVKTHTNKQFSVPKAWSMQVFFTMGHTGTFVGPRWKNIKYDPKTLKDVNNLFILFYRNSLFQAQTAVFLFFSANLRLT